MIKAPDRKTNTCKPDCYDETHEPALGISFEKRDGTRRFVPYALLSALDFNGDDELMFHFSIGTIIARGKCLERLWQSGCKGNLAYVRENEEPSSSETTWVRELAFTNAEGEPDSDIPPFPRAREGSA